MNWIAEQNPYNLVAPPGWFLTMLAARDRDLVILPGIKQPMYRLARRVTKSLGVMTALTHDPETVQMIQLKVVPVTSILPTIRCWLDVIQWLDDHDTWMVGGAEGADRRLSAQEDARLAALQKQHDSEADARGSAGFHALKIRAGEKVFVHSGA